MSWAYRNHQSNQRIAIMQRLLAHVSKSLFIYAHRSQLLLKAIMKGHYSRQLIRISLWLIKTNFSTCQYQRDPPEHWFKTSPKSIIAQYCFTLDVVVVQVQEKATIINDCPHDCRQTLSRSKFHFFHWIFPIHVSTIISILYSINRCPLALYQTLQNLRGQKFHRA